MYSTVIQKQPSKKTVGKRTVTQTSRSQVKSQTLDLQYLTLREAICNTQFYQTTTRHNKIRLYNWFKKLDQIQTDYLWKRNRNNYIRILYLMSQCNCLISPFSNLPTDRDLIVISSTQINAIISQVQSYINFNIRKYGECLPCKQLAKLLQNQNTSNLMLEREDWDAYVDQEGSIDETNHLQFGKLSGITDYKTKNNTTVTYDTKQFSYFNEVTKQNYSQESNCSQSRTNINTHKLKESNIFKLVHLKSNRQKMSKESKSQLEYSIAEDKKEIHQLSTKMVKDNKKQHNKPYRVKHYRDKEDEELGSLIIQQGVKDKSKMPEVKAYFNKKQPNNHSPCLNKQNQDQSQIFDKCQYRLNVLNHQFEFPSTIKKQQTKTNNIHILKQVVQLQGIQDNHYFIKQCRL